jgi:hypothetical protein
MKCSIPQGQHHAWPPIIGLHLKPWMERDIVFDSSAAYDLGNNDNDDVNKLFGFGYINGGHHTDSARFGWNYNKENGRVRLFAYCYVNGTRIIHEICQVPIHKKYRLLINISPSKQYLFTVHDGYNDWHQVGFADIAFTHDKEWRYKLGCYFGGNNPAPHDITIKVSKK